MNFPNQSVTNSCRSKDVLSLFSLVAAGDGLQHTPKDLLIERKKKEKTDNYNIEQIV
jgi:hypothetical protein